MKGCFKSRVRSGSIHLVSCANGSSVTKAVIRLNSALDWYRPKADALVFTLTSNLVGILSAAEKISRWRKLSELQIRLAEILD